LRMDAQQKGAVLIVSIIVLLVLTLINVTAMQTTSLEEKMSVSHQIYLESEGDWSFCFTH
jgi:Tfp pilus assembly protein PilX